jgi:hypothetical protein
LKGGCKFFSLRKEQKMEIPETVIIAIDIETMKTGTKREIHDTLAVTPRLSMKKLKEMREESLQKFQREEEEKKERVQTIMSQLNALFQSRIEQINLHSAPYSGMFRRLETAIIDHFKHIRAVPKEFKQYIFAKEKYNPIRECNLTLCKGTFFHAPFTLLQEKVLDTIYDTVKEVCENDSVILSKVYEYYRFDFECEMIKQVLYPFVNSWNEHYPDLKIVSKQTSMHFYIEFDKDVQI